MASLKPVVSIEEGSSGKVVGGEMAGSAVGEVSHLSILLNESGRAASNFL